MATNFGYFDADGVAGNLEPWNQYRGGCHSCWLGCSWLGSDGVIIRASWHESYLVPACRVVVYVVADRYCRFHFFFFSFFFFFFFFFSGRWLQVIRTCWSLSSSSLEGAMAFAGLLVGLKHAISHR